jgi:phosphoglycerol geranylgeranyltransferase
MRKNLYDGLVRSSASKEKRIAVLIDPDHTSHLDEILNESKVNPPDYFFVGGSLLQNGQTESCISALRSKTEIPVILFPGHAMQISSKADAILLLSVISGRNPDLLIGRHVMAAPQLKASGLEIIPTGYLLIESGTTTSAEYMSNTFPIPSDKHGIAACTAMAGEQLGLKLIYLEAGSGAAKSVPVTMIRSVKTSISVPLIIGGGLRSGEDIAERCEAGADLIVVGNVLEQNPGLLGSFVQTIRTFKQ